MQKMTLFLGGLIMDWMKEVEKRREDLLKDTQRFLQIKSVLTSNGTDEAPFGDGIKQALEFAIEKCKSFGMDTKNLDGYAGHAEIGQGKELIGILCHVDVVPEGDGWTTPPYAADIRDGKIFARGAIDDKGPTMGAIYAVKILKELDLKLNKRVRIIFGTDEESSWRGMTHYFNHEEMPSFGFAPDADFPIIISEKGIVNLSISKKSSNLDRGTNKAIVESFKAGNRVNMVPDFAMAKLSADKGLLENINDAFTSFLSQYDQGGEAELEGNSLTLKLHGISVHGMEPFKGKNAGLELNHFLLSLTRFLHIEDWMEWVDKYLYHDFYGEKLGVKYQDEASGDLTINAGVLHFSDDEMTLKLNIRYPVTTPYDHMMEGLKNEAATIGLDIHDINNSKPHHVDKDHFLVRTLKNVYEEQTGEEATLLSIGGGTYARALETGVAFGPLFPGKLETAHQKDEHIDIEDLLKATAIYVQAIYELAK